MKKYTIIANTSSMSRVVHETILHDKVSLKTA